MADLQVVKRDSALVQFRNMLIARRGELIQALVGTGVSPDQMIRAATTSAMVDPELLERVSFRSFWTALLRACRDGLLPDGEQGAIVSYKASAQWIPMYRGLLLRFHRTGLCKSVWYGFHRNDDKAWRVWSDETGPHFLHDQGPGQGAIIETFAAATTTIGGFYLSVITEKDMERIRAASRTTREDSPWNKWPERMKLKSALRRLTKLTPMMAASGGSDDDDEDGQIDWQDDEDDAPKTTQDALDAFAGSKSSQPPGTSELPPAAPAGEAGAGTHTPTADTSPSHRGTDTSAQELASGQEAARASDFFVAYERGQKARRDGAKREPEEYRDPKNLRLFEAWRAGFRGEPMPKDTPTS